jgi:hypothetical protein
MEINPVKLKQTDRNRDRQSEIRTTPRYFKKKEKGRQRQRERKINRDKETQRERETKRKRDILQEYVWNNLWEFIIDTCHCS